MISERSSCNLLVFCGPLPCIIDDYMPISFYSYVGFFKLHDLGYQGTHVTMRNPVHPSLLYTSILGFGPVNIKYHVPMLETTQTAAQ